MSHWLIRLGAAMQSKTVAPVEPSPEAIEAAKAVDERWVGLYTDDFYADMLREAYAAEIVRAETPDDHSAPERCASEAAEGAPMLSDKEVDAIEAGAVFTVEQFIASHRAQAVKIEVGDNVIDALRTINRRLGSHVPKDICGGCGIPKADHDDQCQPDPEW